MMMNPNVDFHTKIGNHLKTLRKSQKATTTENQLNTGTEI